MGPSPGQALADRPWGHYHGTKGPWMYGQAQKSGSGLHVDGSWRPDAFADEPGSANLDTNTCAKGISLPEPLQGAPKAGYAAHVRSGCWFIRRQSIGKRG